ncbi:hypothetical protein IT895_02000 [Halomonas sp. A40-4]|uniref:hypothetical protein n=1 Tax=Halomonas sp. A40-4 TaxID=2785909 RepID=UPI0018EF7F10|nr:hypothetical protein [Halomonas sp. A40-4]QPL46612.1 hypothetical protein IT895_02000 [Halomonas sp. A40-4]
MNEIVKLISSLSVLIAAFAGLNAINKWKAEKFDKEKIHYMERFYNSLISCKSNFYDFRKGNFDENCYIEQIQEVVNYGGSFEQDEEEEMPYGPLGYFIKDKKAGFSNIRKSNYKSKNLLEKYMKFSGGYPAFYYNIFDSLKRELENCIYNVRFNYNNKFEDRDLDAEVKLKRYFDESSNAQIFDVLMLHNEFRSIDVNRLITIDSFDDFFKKLVVLSGLEVRFEHSSVIMKPFKFMKIFYLKHDLRSSVIFGVGDIFLYIDVDGSFVRKEANGKKLSCFEKDIRKGLFRREVYYMSKQVFLE